MTQHVWRQPLPLHDGRRAAPTLELALAQQRAPELDEPCPGRFAAKGIENGVALGLGERDAGGAIGERALEHRRGDRFVGTADDPEAVDQPPGIGTRYEGVVEKEHLPKRRPAPAVRRRAHRGVFRLSLPFSAASSRHAAWLCQSIGRVVEHAENPFGPIRRKDHQ